MMVASQPVINLINLTFLTVDLYPSLKTHILFHNNGPAIWHGLPDIRHIKANYDRWSAKVDQTS